MLEHAGGGKDFEWSEGEPHPLTDPFNTQNTLTAPDGDCYTIDEMGMALGKVINWITNDGNFQPRGVYNRALTLGFLMQNENLGLSTQSDLARKLKISRYTANIYIRDFTDKFEFKTTAQRVHEPRPNNHLGRAPREKKF